MKEKIYGMPKPARTNLSVLEENYLALDNNIELLKTQKEHLKEQILLAFEKAHIKKDDKLQLVLQERVSLDHLGIKSALSLVMWNKIKKEEVDPAKFFAAVRMGEIAQEIEDKAVTRKEIKVLRKC